MSTEIVVNADLTKAIQDSLNPADIRTVVQAEIERQEAAAAVVAADQATADKAAAAAKAAAESTSFSRTETIGGREFTFEASNELELERMISNAYRVAYAIQPTETPAVVVDPAIAAAAEQEAAEKEVVAKAELERKFKLGEISPADYIEQSGALRDYLAKQGVPLDALKAAVDHNQDTAEAQSWADATQEFLNGPVGADWPGGDKNLKIIGDKLAALGLVDATDKVAALGQAYAAMKATGTIFPYEAPAAVVVPAAVVPAVVVPAAVVPAAVAPAAPRVAATSSSIFGASSGMGGNEGVSKLAPVGDVKIDPKASPEEIIEAWKKANVAAGKDPNAAFTETFSGRRV